VDYEFEGQVRETEKTAASAQTALPVILITLFSIVIWTFRSSLQAVILYSLIPFGLIGTGLGHFVHDVQISLLSMLGFVALIGIIVNDGLVFISSFNDRIRHGTKIREALIETGRSRFRPILLTTITTVAGLAPLIFEKSFQAQFLIPMAITIAYGLVVATVLLLGLLPALLLIANYLRRALHWIWEGEWVEPELVEPAYKELHWEEIDV
jgi:multidrug efflux pump subunit AcrB